MNLKEVQSYTNNKHLMMYRADTSSYDLHWHNEFELVYVLKGDVCYGLNYQKITLNAGDFIFVNSGDIHCLEENNYPADVFTLVINNTLIHKYFDTNMFYTSVFHYEKLNKNANYHKILPLIELIFEEYQSQELYSEHIVSNFIQTLFIYLQRCFTDATPLRLPNQMVKEATTCKAIIEFFNNTEPMYFTLKSLANHLGYSQNHVCKVFKKIFNQSFYQYALEYKISLSKHLLTTTNLRIIDIAYKCGFSSERAFNIAFKRELGTTPSKYKKSVT